MDSVAEKIKIIIECEVSPERDKIIGSIGKIKYKLPALGFYVVEAEPGQLFAFRGIEGVRAARADASVMAQSGGWHDTINARNCPYKGAGVTIAVLDTGISPVDDFTRPVNRIVSFMDFINGGNEPYDDNAHGTHVSGVAAGNGISSGGRYAGIAPLAGIAAVKILSKTGSGDVSDALAGIQWIIDNKEKYNIRAANLSIGSADAGSGDPLVKAVETAWDRGIVMIIAAGNNGPARSTVTSPGISRKAITVGASDDSSPINASPISSMNAPRANFSGRGPTFECIVKPDIVAPGYRIISCRARSGDLSLGRAAELNFVGEDYIMMSGTSMSAPFVTGAAALLCEKYPQIRPDDVKLALKRCAKKLALPKNQQGWGLLDVGKLLSSEVTHVRRN